MKGVPMTSAVLRSLSVGVLSAVICGAAAVTASAQGLDSPPDPTSLAGSAAANRRQTLNGTVTALGAANTGQSRADLGAEQYGLQSAFAWAKGTRHALFALSDGVAMRYVPTERSTVGTYHSVGAGVTLTLGRTRIMARQGVIISPYYSIIEASRTVPDTTSDLVAPITTDARETQRQRSYTTRLEAAQPLTRRVSLAWTGHFDDTRFPGGLAQQQNFGAGVHATRGLSRSFGLLVGYQHEQATYASLLGNRYTIISRTIDGGFSYRREVLRRTTVHATTGISQLQSPSGPRQYDMTGAAGFTRQFGRTWSTSVDYVRGTRFIPGLIAPVFSDNSSVSAGGALGRRISASVRVGYGVGLMDSAGSRHRTQIGDASGRIRIALSRQVASSLEYLFSDYKLNRTDILAAGYPEAFNGSTVRLRFDVALPLIH
jgi:hypothetical protein